jgi:hypothetical protein
MGLFSRKRKQPFFNTPTEAELQARAERDAAHAAKVAEARTKMIDLGVYDVQPLIKVTRKRARAIAAANSAPQIVFGESA